MKTIRRQILVYLFTGMALATLAAGLLSYWKMRIEVNEMFDYQIKQVAGAIPTQLSVVHALPSDDDADDEIIVQMWNPSGQLVFTSTPSVPLPRASGFGFRSIELAGQKWRTYSEEDEGQQIQVAQPQQVRNRMAASMALRSLIPFMALIPLLGMLIWIVVDRGLSPLHRLAEAVSQRSPSALDPLERENYPPEIHPMIDALNDLLARLDQAILTQRTFVADAAHELRTPLAALKLQLQLVERETDRDLAATGFRKLHDRINRATHVVQQLLTLARQEHRSSGLAYKPVDLQQLAAQAISDHIPQAECKKIDLGLSVAATAAGSASTVPGDANSLRIMLGNLIDNAVRYTPANGRVDVFVDTSPEGDVLLTVVDDGPGIPAVDRARVFDRFYRCEGTLESGSGLGLFIARAIADQHGAVIELGPAHGDSGLAATVRFKRCAQDHLTEGCLTAFSIH